jgi:hypothetical protein
MNLYKVEIVHDINLKRDGDLHILSNHIDSPFMNPEIFPSTRVGRWETIPHLENFVELDHGQYYKIKLFNYTWFSCVASVSINDHPIGAWKLGPRRQITIEQIPLSNQNPYQIEFTDLPSLMKNQIVIQNVFSQKEDERRYSCDDNRLRFGNYGTQSDLIQVLFRPEQWTEHTLANLMNGECKEVPIKNFNTTKETLMSIRLIPKRRYDFYPTVVGLRH